jgi:nucleoid-associated protein Lsr2
MMAQKVTVALEDDLTGGPAAETVRFAFEGAGYEIDLSTKNAKAFRKLLAPYVEHARKAGRAQGQRGRPQGRRGGRTVASRQRSGDIRAWAKQNGLAVSERGRIPASVVVQYQAAVNGR